MRIQFTNAETESIENSRINGIAPEDSFVPSEIEGRIITLGLHISDPYKFNMFINRFFTDPSIKDQIGAEIAGFDLGAPINRESLFTLKDCIDNIICGEPLILNNVLGEDQT